MAEPIAIDEAEEKEYVEEYVRYHKLEQVLNAAINRIVKDRPEDPYILLAELIKQESTSEQGILYVEGEQVLDSTGYPTIQARITTERGVFEACVSSQVLGLYDPVEPVVNDEGDEIASGEGPFESKGMELVASELNLNVQSMLEQMDPTHQQKVDEMLSGLVEKIGRNATLALSIANCKAGAKHQNLPLYHHIATLADQPIESACIPVPLVSCLHGGMWASNKLYVRDILCMPLNASSFRDAVRISHEVVSTLRKSLESKGLGFCNTGVLGGMAPLVQSVEEALQLIQTAIKSVKEKEEGIEIGLIVDVKANDFHLPPANETDSSDAHFYNLNQFDSNAKTVFKSSEDLLRLLQTWKQDFEIMTFVDPFDSEDLKSFGQFNNAENQKSETEDSAATNIGGDGSCKLQIIGHSILSHGIERLIDENACNTICISPTEFSTVSEAIDIVTKSRNNALAIVIGSEPGDTDSFLVDLAVGCGIGQVKFGGLSVACSKLNRLLELSKEEYGIAYTGTEFRK